MVHKLSVLEKLVPSMGSETKTSIKFPQNSKDNSLFYGCRPSCKVTTPLYKSKIIICDSALTAETALC
jgi:hypothetical protein